MEQIDKKILKIHNYIYANEGLSNSETLDEILKIFYCKILDEQSKNNALLTSSGKVQVDALNSLYDQFKSLLANVIDKNEKIKLKPSTINFILSELQNVQFSKITSDVKGHILQKIIDRSYRESRGQFFTPAPVVNFIVEMIQPKRGEKGADPASGTGGFMFSALEYIEKNEGKSKDDIKNIYFYDISKSLIKLIVMRMMFEYSTNNVNCVIQDSIETDLNDQFDFILTNPPFGTQGKILNPEILRKYKMGINADGQIIKSQVPDILFVEKVINMLKVNGRAAIVLPDGDFENPTLQYFRQYLVNNVRIDAIISLPDGTFIPYGTGVKSSIIFITKLPLEKLQQKYSVFYSKITKLGYTFSKHSKDLLLPNGDPEQDYMDIVKAYKSKKYNDKSYIVPIEDIIKNKYILSENYYSPELNDHIDKIKKGRCLPLKNLVDFNYAKCSIDKEKSYNYIEISDVNAYTNEIINSTQMLGEDLPSRASYVLKTGDLMVATAGNSIGTSKHACAIVNSKYNNCVCTNGFTIMTPTNISGYYLLNFFNSKDFLIQIQKYRYGTAIPCIAREDFENILVPIYSKKEIEDIHARIQKALDLREQALALMDK